MSTDVIMALSLNSAVGLVLPRFDNTVCVLIVKSHWPIARVRADLERH
jgi:hypothetical protein